MGFYNNTSSGFESFVKEIHQWMLDNTSIYDPENCIDVRVDDCSGECYINIINKKHEMVVIRPKIPYLKYKFGTCDCDLIIRSHELHNTIGFPKEVFGYFKCVCPGISTIDDFPTHIGKYASIDLKSLRYFNIDKNIYCEDTIVFKCGTYLEYLIPENCNNFIFTDKDFILEMSLNSPLWDKIINTKIDIQRNLCVEGEVLVQPYNMEYTLKLHKYKYNTI